MEITIPIGGFMKINFTEKKLARKLIKNLFRTQEVFSVVSGIDEARLSKILRGIRKPTNDQKVIFEKLLEVPVNDLFPEDLAT